LADKLAVLIVLISFEIAKFLRAEKKSARESVAGPRDLHIPTF
jgi:hypothetical protein